MFEDLSVLFSWQTVLMCLAIYGIVFIFRRFLEGIRWLDLKDKIYWRDVIIPTSPLIFGALIGVLPASSNLTPGSIGATMFNRIIFCLVCGLASSYVYAKVFALIKSVKLSGLTSSSDGTETVVSTETTVTSAPPVTTSVTPPPVITTSTTTTTVPADDGSEKGD